MDKTDRRLAAIMFTDMVGYSALSQRNESLALDILEEQRKILRGVFIRHGGREVKTIGDGFLVEFGSALDAARSGYDMQNSLREHNLQLPSEKRMTVRIGIHLGDVVQAGDDVYGDSVNIASRIEPVAEPGGICISQQVFDQVKNKCEFPIVSLGKREVKNIQGEIEIYKIVLPSINRAEDDASSKLSSLDRRRLAVLPLVSLTSDPEDEFFSDGLTEEMISTISQIQELRVISRTSIMRFKKTSKSLGEIGRELSVGSVLEGSIRKYGSKIRVSAQLIDVGTDEHLWSQNYDRELSDVFVIQSDIAKSVADSLKIRLLEEERRQIQKTPTKSSEAHNLYLKGRYFWNERSAQSIRKGIECFEKATEKDPSYALAYVGVADCYIVLGEHGQVPMKEASGKAKAFAKKALHLDDSLAEAHTSLAASLTGFEHSKSEQEFKKAIELKPNYATAHHWYGLMLWDKRDMDAAISEARKAVDLDPLSMQIRTFLASLYFDHGQVDESLKELERVIHEEPDFAPAHLWLALVCADKKLYERGIREGKQGVALSSSGRYKATLGYVCALAGKMGEAARTKNELIEASKNQFVSYIDLAVLCTGMGSYDEALDWLEKAHAERGEIAPHNLNAKWFAPLRSFKRYQDLQRKINWG